MKTVTEWVHQTDSTTATCEKNDQIAANALRRRRSSLLLTCGLLLSSKKLAAAAARRLLLSTPLVTWFLLFSLVTVTHTTSLLYPLSYVLPSLHVVAIYLSFFVPFSYRYIDIVMSQILPTA